LPVGDSFLLDDVDVAVRGSEEEPTPAVARVSAGDVADARGVSDESDLRGGQFFTRAGDVVNRGGEEHASLECRRNDALVGHDPAHAVKAKVTR